MHKVIFLRSQHPSTDSRLNKYLDALDKAGAEYKVIGWNREGYKNDADSSNWKLYQKSTPIGGGIKNIISLIFWNIYLLINLFRVRKEYTLIHAVDFDTIMPAWLIGKLFRKKIIYDIYDKYSDSRGINGVIATLMDSAERFFSKSVDLLLVADQCRYEQLGIKESDPKKTLVIENIPRVDFEATPIPPINEVIKLSYVGILEKRHRGLEDLLEVVSAADHLHLEIAGDGPLRELIIDYAQRYPNIFYHGPVEYKKALEIMSNSHIIVALYYLTNRNHIYAAPNKYWEHLFLGRALLTTKGTNPGNKVAKYNTGIVVEDNKAALTEALDKNNIVKNILVEYSLQSVQRWKNAKFEFDLSSIYRKDV